MQTVMSNGTNKIEEIIINTYDDEGDGEEGHDEEKGTENDCQGGGDSILSYTIEPNNMILSNEELENIGYEY